MKRIMLAAGTILMFVNTGIYAAPTNEQLYQMLLDLKKEVAESKTRESNLQSHLEQAKAELETAKKQLRELPQEVKQKQSNVKEGFSISAGGLYVKPSIDHRYSTLDKLNAEPGFRVALGYQAHDNWDYALKYKHFNTDTIGNIDNQNILSSIFSTLNSAGYKSNYNVLDFEIGKLFLPAEDVSLRISGGIRYASLNEQVNYHRVSSYLYYSQEAKYEVKNKFWSLGPRITAAPTWRPFGNNFRIFGNVGASFLMGQQHETYNSQYVSSFSSQNYNNSRRQDSFVTMIEAGSGVGYTLKADLVDIDFQAGYEFEHWLMSDQTENILFRGFHGAYGTVGVTF